MKLPVAKIPQKKDIVEVETVKTRARPGYLCTYTPSSRRLALHFKEEEDKKK